MRKLGLSLLLIATGAASVIACSSTADEDTEGSVGALTDEELARSALSIMGAPKVAQPGQQKSCGFTGCHSINPVTLKHWQDQYKEAMAVIDSDRPNEDKINYFRQNPNDPRTGFTPERVGILSAGAHLALGPNVNRDKHPETFKQGEKLAQIFAGKTELYREFRKKMLMPVDEDYARLEARQYETILTWFKKGMPKLDELIAEQRPTECRDDFERLRQRTIAAKRSTWAAKNFSDRMPMFACPPPNPDQPVSPTNCFAQQRDGKDIFPKAVDQEFARGWALDGSSIRILREFSAPNSFWVRTSADGRFVATGGGREGGAQAMDLQATLDDQSRDIGLQASYDPDFWPDNKAFMFQSGAKFCAQSLLEKRETRLVTFGEPECSNLSSVTGLYQTVGQVVGDNSLSDRFLLFSIWAGDSGQYSASARDTAPKAGADAAINVYTAVAKGNDVEDGYQVTGDAVKIPTEYRGDTMMGRSGTLIGSRWAYGARDGKTDAGYAIETLERRLDEQAGKYVFKLDQVGNICMKGNKANFSFDERFLSTHHYNEPADYPEADAPAYAAKGSSDVWVADFITGKKVKVTKMGPGQFALYPHFRSDGWLYFLVVDYNGGSGAGKYYAVASDWAVRQTELSPTP